MAVGFSADNFMKMYDILHSLAYPDGDTIVHQQLLMPEVMNELRQLIKELQVIA